MQKIAILLFLLSALPLFAEISLSGKIGDMTLDTTGNPFKVIDNIVVPAGKTLKIKEGAILLFKPFTGLIVEGSLIVEGTLEKPVIFTTENDAKYNPVSTQAANAFDWNGILITPKAGSVKLSNFVLEYSVYGVKSQKVEFIITNGTFSNNGQFHVTVNDAVKNVIDDMPFAYGKTPEENLDSEKMHTKTQKPAKPAATSGVHASWRKPTGICLGVVGLSAIGAGGYFYYLSTNYASKYATATAQADMDDYRVKKNSAHTTAIVCAIGGVVSVACGIVVYPWKPETKGSKNLAVVPILGKANGILISFNF